MLRVAEQAERTDTGRERTANEDSYFSRAPVFAVADGMGGAQAGEVASRIATDAFESGNEADRAPEAYLEAITREANRQINELARRDKERSGMGTTLTAAMITGNELSVAHVGDSRAYLFRDGELRQLTTDHSLVEELRRQGRLTREEAAVHPQRSIITRALGPEPEVEVDTASYPARDGDLVLLCSDGLTAMVDDERIAEVIDRSDSLKQAARTLVNEANARGGRDNITVVIFRLEQVEGAAPGDVQDEVTVVGMPAVEAPEPDHEARPRRAAGGKAPARAAGAPDTARSAPEPARRLAALRARFGAPLVRAALGLLVLGAVIAAAVIGIRQIHFLGVDEGGRPALYRGLPYELPFGIELYSERYSLPIQASAVDPDRVHVLSDHDLRSHDDAVSLLDDLHNEVTAEGSSGDRANPVPGPESSTGGQG